MLKNSIFFILLISSSSALTFRCTFGVKAINGVTHYSCNQPYISNINVSQYLTEVQGTHEAGKSNLDVKVLSIFNPQNLTFFPKGVEHFFPNLIAIAMNYADILSFIGNEFRAFPQLTWMDLGFNPKLQRIPGNLFEFNPLVGIISFNNCDLKFIGQELFDSLTNLTGLYVQNNHCVNDYASFPSAMVRVRETIAKNCTDVCAGFLTSSESSLGGENLREIVGKLEEENFTLKRENEEILRENIEIKNQLMKIKWENLNWSFKREKEFGII